MMMQNLPDFTRACVAEAVGHVRSARNSLSAAVYVLDEAGYSCAALNDLNADTYTLVSDWSGRGRPAEPQAFPEHITAAAAAWRKAKGRTY